jgi:hypothetical protein
VGINVSQRLRDHLTVIIGECDLLEDTLGARSDAMTSIKVIRNAAYRVAKAIEGESWMALEILAGTPPDSVVRPARQGQTGSSSQYPR